MRIRILMRLFLNPEQKTYLRELSNEFNASSGQVSEELRQMKKAGILQATKSGRQILYQANKKHPLFHELTSIVQKAMGMDKILESIIRRLGNLEKAYLVDDYAEGRDTGIIDLILVGKVDKENLADLVQKTEKYIGRKIRTLVLDREEFQKMKKVFNKRSILLLWESEEVLVDA